MVKTSNLNWLDIFLLMVKYYWLLMVQTSSWFSSSDLLLVQHLTFRSCQTTLSIFDGGRQLLANLLQTNISGLTGLVGFNHDRSVIRPSFDIISVVVNQGWVLGYWSNHSGPLISLSRLRETLYAKPLNRSSSNQHLRSVVWLRNTTEKPHGWEFSNNNRPLRIEVPLDHKLDSSAWVFLRPFTSLVWVVTTVFFIFIGIVVWILEHGWNDEFRGSPKQKFFFFGKVPKNS
uniref:Putative periplasmic binding protein-like I n=1 Tax=Helianthus annuus TaxID=4232 RepID=A0A251VA90_HELAN